MTSLPLHPMRTSAPGYEEWYFPREHKWVRHYEDRWAISDWSIGGPQSWVEIGRDDIIHTPEEAMAAWTATRRME